MSARRFAAHLIAAALAAGCAAAGPAAARPATPNAPCFFVSQWQGWKAPSPDVIYLGVNMHDVYRVDLSAGSSQLMWPNAHLVSIVRGGDSICSAIDLDLKVSDSSGIATPLIAKTLTKLTPEEVAAIPRKDRPN